MLGSMFWYGEGGVAPELVRGGEKRPGLSGNTSDLGLSVFCLGEARAGEEEEEEELTELSEERLRREEMGEKADFSLVCWRR